VTGHFETPIPAGYTYILQVDVWTPAICAGGAVGPVMDDVDVVIQVEPDLGACQCAGYELILGSTVLTGRFRGQ